MASEKGRQPKRRKAKASAQPARRASRRPSLRRPVGYAALLEALKARIRAAQVKAALSVNRELVQLYWDIGRQIVERQKAEGWGKAVVERLGADLQREFPGVASVSSRNLWHARAFYLAYAAEGRELKQAVSEIPWGHNIVLLQKVKDPAQRLWYARQTTANGWSRSMLVHWIESGLYARQGKAVTNFPATLPPPQSDLATEILKDPYNFDFLTLRTDAAERQLHQGLLDHIRKFLLELGAGFAFVGSEYHLAVADQDYYIDLLFYHLRLHCYVVIELKVEAFKPEFAGKMSFYLSALDDRLRDAPTDGPSIGLILCKEHNRIVVEYALRDMRRPMGVAGYEVRTTRRLPQRLQGDLPTPAELRDELRKADKANGGPSS